MEFGLCTLPAHTTNPYDPGTPSLDEIGANQARSIPALGPPAPPPSHPMTMAAPTPYDHGHPNAIFFPSFSSLSSANPAPPAWASPARHIQPSQQPQLGPLACPVQLSQSLPAPAGPASGPNQA